MHTFQSYATGVRVAFRDILLHQYRIIHALYSGFSVGLILIVHTSLPLIPSYISGYAPPNSFFIMFLLAPRYLESGIVLFHNNLIHQESITWRQLFP